MPAITYPFVEALVAERSRPGSRTLDVGCGAGQYRSAAGGRYVGVDLPDLQYGVPPDVFADAEQLPFGDSTYDLAFGVASFYNVRDAARAFRECHRVLRASGSLLVVGYQPDEARRQQQRSPAHRHTWSFAELQSELLAAGFAEVIDRTATARVHRVGPPWRRLISRLRATVPRGRIWLVVEARP